MPDITYINNFINEGKNATISLKNFYDTILVGDANDDTNIFRMPIGDFFLEHAAELKPTIQFYALPDTYFYKPKALSLLHYGTTEMWLALLRLNGMKSVCEFNLPMIKMYDPDPCMEIIKTYFKREGKL